MSPGSQGAPFRPENLQNGVARDVGCLPRSFDTDSMRHTGHLTEKLPGGGVCYTSPKRSGRRVIEKRELLDTSLHFATAKHRDEDEGE